jgi:hypothetical protein
MIEMPYCGICYNIKSVLPFTEIIYGDTILICRDCGTKKNKKYWKHDMEDCKHCDDQVSCASCGICETDDTAED